MIEVLCNWYQKNKRALPWRTTKTAYAIWVSEIMCQQTRIETVIPYYLRFMEALPTIESLAAASEALLLKLWQGLGYYNRVRNMQKAAQTIVEKYHGIFPEDYAQARSLPGIGDYTAGAILSIAYAHPYAAIDGNALRVLSRYFMVDQDISTNQTKAYWKQQVESWSIPNFGVFNQAVMDLGATICVPYDVPRCEQCPLSGSCLAHLKSRELDYPVKQKKTTKVVEELTVFLIQLNGKILLHKRPNHGLLAGMYELVNLPGQLSRTEVKKHFQKELVRIEVGPTLNHQFTHKKWVMYSYYLKLSEYELKRDEGLYSLAEIEHFLSIPQAFLQFLNYIKELGF